MVQMFDGATEYKILMNGVICSDLRNDDEAFSIDSLSPLMSKICAIQ